MRKIKSYFIIIPLMFIFSRVLCASSDTLYFKSFDNLDVSSCEDEKHCLSLDHLIKRTRSKSFTSQKGFNKLYQYGQYVKSSVGRLLPHLNFGVVSGTAILDPSILFSLCGFVLPSNWYKWKESRLQYLAQRYSMINLLANQVRLGEILYYNLHREITATRIYDHYFEILDSILSYMRTHHKGNINTGDISIVEALRSDMNVTSLFIQDTVADLLPKLGYELALDINEDWESLSLKEMPLPDLTEVKALNANDYIEESWANSDNLKSIYYMIEAANYTLKSRYFQWMSPFSFPEFGLGLSLGAQIKITKKQGEMLKIKYEQEKSWVKYNAYSAFGVHNTAVLGFQESTRGRASIKKLMDYVINQIKTGGKVDVHQLYEGIILAVEFDMLRNYAQHLYLLTKSQIRRLLKEGKYYKKIEKNLPKYHQDDQKDFLLKLENHRIKKGLKKGKIKLLEEDYKLFYYDL